MCTIKLKTSNHISITYIFRLPDGTWTGVVGDLIKGDIDISVAALTMTTEREEGRLFIFLNTFEFNEI